jgi:hypothetical protein
MAMRTSIYLRRPDVVVYFMKALRHYKDKKMLVVSFNTGSHWVTLLISIKYEQVYYYDSSRPIDSRTDDQLTYDWSDVMSVLDEYFLHFSF